MTKVIGLTGGIGSGKSTVSRFLAELGAVNIDADKIGHEAFKPDTVAWREVVSAFGREVLTTEDAIDREKLGKIVFGDPESLARLNRIMHPRMYEIARTMIYGYRQQGTAVVVLEAPLLIEAGWTDLADEVWVVVASEAMVLKRLQQRTGLSPAESRERIRSQLPTEERLKHADVVINNDGDLDKLKARVEELWLRLKLQDKKP